MKKYFLDFDNILKILLIIGPIIYWSNVSDVIIKQAFYVISVFLIIASSYFSIKERTLDGFFYAAIIGLSSFCYLLTLNPFAFSGTIMLVLGLLAYEKIYKHSENFDFSDVFKVVLLINVPLILFQKFGYDPIYTHWINPGVGEEASIESVPRVTGFFLKTTYCGFYLALSMCFIRLRYCPFVLVFIFWTEALISLFAGSVIFCWKIINIIEGSCKKHINRYRTHTPHAIVILGFLLICALVGFLKYDVICHKLITRMGIWTNIFEACLKNPFGHGVGIFKSASISSVYTGEFNVTWKDIHCQYFQVLYSLGIGGIVLSFFYLKKILKNLNTPLGMAVVCCLIGFCFQSFLQAPVLLLTIISIFSLKEAENYDCKMHRYC